MAQSQHIAWLLAILSCRFIQVGNEFNGLFTEAKEKPSELLDVPLEIFGKPKALDPSRGSTASLLIETLGLRRRRMLRTQEEKGRAWLQGSYLAVRICSSNFPVRLLHAYARSASRARARHAVLAVHVAHV